MLSFRITISKEDGENVWVRVDELKNDGYHFNWYANYAIKE